MKLGIMQPYFFPNMAHFALIASVDKWVVFDVTQYTPKTWMNRNRILHPKEGWQYLTVPLKKSSISIKIDEATVLDLAKTRQSMLGKISHYKKKAPHFYQVKKLLQEVFDAAINEPINGLVADSLTNLNIHSLKAVCAYLGWSFSFQIASQLKLDYSSNMQPGDWAPFICQQLGASDYINPVGGKDLFNPGQFRAVGTRLHFAEFQYASPCYEYESHLSILDTMMWKSADQINAELRQNLQLLQAN